METFSFTCRTRRFIKKNIAKRQVKTAKSLVVEVLKWKEECIDTERSKSVVEVFDIDSLVEGDEK